MANLPKANKELGQHFLTSPKVINMITNDFKEQADVIFEVGPGPAILSKKLSDHKKPYYIIEKDSRFLEYVKGLTADKRIFITDALKFNWSEFLTNENLQLKKCWMVSNLPYNIGVPLLMSFVVQTPIQFMTLMFQKEVGQKTITDDNNKKMSSLKGLCQNYFKCKTLLKVPPGAFSPPPKVDSIVVSYVRIEKPVVSLNDFKYFEAFLRTTFQFRRKQLKQNLKQVVPAAKLGEIIDENIIALTRRAETLSMAEIHYLFKCLRPFFATTSQS
ncbi:MAG: 16S rRNA (adenine1518-N6/adenine1519-N6)-dimethyltransferase [Thermoproteota archaeon]|jgi:16S rRNA (adenine1518-N6/adenine1519-N6)-dimethyltransferase